MAKRRLIVEVIGDASSLERTFKRAEVSTSRLGKATTTAAPRMRALSGAYVGTTAAALALGGAVKASFSELFESQKVAAQTEAALQSTGYAAGVAAEDIDKLAASLMEMSGIDDEVIKSGENLLLTFTNIRNEVGVGNDIFNQATKAALDMSVALGTDMQSSVIRLGKALNDPVKGITALRRVGVQFTDAQRDQIAALVKTGDTLEAQKIILKELQVEFGGSAKAAGETLPGQLSKARESAKNLGATFAEILAPAIIDATEALNDFLTGLQKLNDSPRAAAGGFLSFFKSDFARRAGEVLPTVGPLVGALNTAFHKAGKESGEKFVEGFADAVANSPRAEAAAARAAQSLGGKLKRAVPKPQPGASTPFLNLLGANADATKSLFDDLAIARRRIDVLAVRLRRAGTLKAKTELRQELNTALQTEQQILATIRAQNKATEDARKEAAKAAREARQRAAARQRQITENRQFRALGFGPGGSELVPNAESLRKTLGRISEAVKGTFLDTKANRSMFAAIRRVLSGQLGKVSAEVRAFIDGLLDDIDDSLDDRSKNLGQKWRKINADAFLRSLGLNLTPEQYRKLRAGLLGLGPNLTVPPRHTPAFAAATGAGGVTVNGDVHVHGVQNWRQFEEIAAKRAKSRPQPRRGGRRGG